MIELELASFSDLVPGSFSAETISAIEVKVREFSQSGYLGTKLTKLFRAVFVTIELDQRP